MGRADGRKDGKAVLLRSALQRTRTGQRLWGSVASSMPSSRWRRGEMDEAQFIAFLTRSLRTMARQLDDGAILQICMDWRHLFELQTAARAANLSLLNLCVWNKTNAGMGSLYRSKHELVLILKKGDAPHVNNVALGKHGRNRTNVWDYPGINGFGKNRLDYLAAHPTVKPVAMVADALCDVTRHGDLVIDGFVGSGTTILGRRARRTNGIWDRNRARICRCCHPSLAGG